MAVNVKDGVDLDLDDIVVTIDVCSRLFLECCDRYSSRSSD